MKLVNSLESVSSVTDPDIRQLVQQRIDDLGGDKFSSADLGYILVIEPGPGDTLEAIQVQVDFDILSNRWTGLRYDQEGFTPSFEFIEDVGFCYDMVFIVSDTGWGIEVFVPKVEGISPELLDMCKRFATPPFPDLGPA
jgi:hypothetical protein